MPSPPDGVGGFTFIEVVVILAVSALAITGIIIGFHEGVEGLALQRDLRSATVLAEDLMHEIRAKSFAGPRTLGSDRRNFDDVSDYDGWSRSPPETIEGVAMSDCAGFRRSATVTEVRDDLVTQGPTNSSFKRITVVVSSANAAVTNVSAVSEYDDQ